MNVARINAEANRRGGANKYRGFGDDLRGLYLAEGLAGAPWSMAEVNDAELCTELIQHYKSLGLAPPGTLTAGRVAEVRGAARAAPALETTLAPRNPGVQGNAGRFRFIAGHPDPSLTHRA